MIIDKFYLASFRKVLAELTQAVRIVIGGLAVALLFSGCGSGGSNELATSDSGFRFESVELVQVDSIMIPIMGNVRVFDYSSRLGLFLASDVPDAMLASMPGGPSKNELGIMLIDKQGKVVSQFSRSDDGPEGHGSSAGDIFFMEDESIGVLAKRGLFQYDFEGKLLHKYKALHSRNMIGSPNYKITEVGTSGKIALANPKLTASIYNHWDSLYALAKPFGIYDLSKLQNDEAMTEGTVREDTYPSIPVYQPASKALTMEMAPRLVMNEEEQEVSLLFHEYPRLFVYSLETGEKLREVDLAPDDFGPHVVPPATEGQEYYDWINNGGWMASSYYHDLIQLGDFTLTRYNPALPAAKVKELMAGKGPREYELWPSIRKKNYNFRYQLFEGDTKVIRDFTLPGLEPREGQMAFTRYDRLAGNIIGGDGLNKMYVFMTNDGDIERDYQLIRVYSLNMQ